MRRPHISQVNILKGTTAMDFATLPPEINSGRMYAGPGPDSMTEAATAWERLAIRLFTAAADCRAVIAKVAAMSQAATAYLDWLTATATQAEHAAAQARAAASTYKSAQAATVPPPLIEANRAQLRSLARVNCLAQITPAIADTDAAYERMWAQDTEAMYGYARASADASPLKQFGSPPAATEIPASADWSLIAAPEVIAAGSQVVATIPEALQAFSLSPLTTFYTSLSSVSSPLSKLGSLSAPQGDAIRQLDSLNKAAALRWLLPNQGGARGPEIIAGLARAASIGALSVPRAWPSATSAAPQDASFHEPIRLVRAGQSPGAFTEG
jgi:PPE-repeat protein